MWRFLCHCHFRIFIFCRFISRFIIPGVCKAYQKLSEVNGRIANSTMFRLGTSGAQSSSIAVAALQWFPTCQVRVVRFYHSCSRLASPPSSFLLPSSSFSSFSSRLLILLVLRLLLCQALRQLFAKLFANVRAQWAPLDLNLGTCPAQWAPLDLNLGPSELSERWTSTWDLPSSVSTAGPQPGTCPAQWAPLDLNLEPAQLSELPEDIPNRMPEDMPSRVPEDMPDRMPEGMPAR